MGRAAHIAGGRGGGGDAGGIHGGRPGWKLTSTVWRPTFILKIGKFLMNRSIKQDG
ncbi:hypothetical protein L810_4873 [Burkholderia sp. AU4i]|nr:hypothetical protein L810_4873 [Burkholderia sp. AU4i]QOH33482.1 hypothetical protein C7S14_6390 [Burkholderia cepacia]